MATMIRSKLFLLFTIASSASALILPDGVVCLPCTGTILHGVRRSMLTTVRVHRVDYQRWAGIPGTRIIAMLARRKFSWRQTLQ